MMKIVVTTPTGRVGSRVVRLLLQAGVRPTLLLRDPARLDPDTRGLVDCAQADQRDADAVLAATEGADAVYWVSPPTDAEDPIAAHAAMGAIAASAVEQHGIGRVVFQSSGGAERRSGTGEIDGLAATEVALDATGASVLHLRCGMFFTNLLMDSGALEEGVLRVTLPVDLRLPWVDPRDGGDVAAARLLSAAWTGHQVQAVHGPADLNYREIAAIVGEATGRPMVAEQIPDDDMRAALRAAGMGERQVEAMVGMSIGVRENPEPADPRTVVTTTPTTLRAWACEHLG
jgi:NAD(P)H dehydrogenase (quinone)